jgi:CheY-like chemotaxis protein
VFHFIQTANGAHASARILIGFPPPETGGAAHRANLGVIFRTGRRLGPMPEPTTGPPPGTITVLSLSRAEYDQAVLQQVFRDSGLTLYPNCRPALQPSRTLASALAALRKYRIPIVLCDGDGLPDAWKEILRVTRKMPAPPCVIVTSRMAGDRRWAEVLQNGAFDLLSKPFDESDVMRIIHSAWIHWQNRYGAMETAAEYKEPATGT